MASRVVAAPLAQLPNALTIGRLAVIPPFVALLLLADDGQSWPAAILFAVAAATDQVDGWLARRWHAESAFGKVADPLADRLLIDAAVVLLFLDDRLPWLALLLVVGRDLLMIVGYKVVVPRGYDFDVSFLGKLATWVLYASLAFIMVTPPEADWPLAIFWTGVGLAAVAGIQYVLKARREVER